MCGICGKISRDTGKPVDAALIRHMTDVLEHRGPDAAGWHVKGPVGMGHRRLRIIDLAGGKQPMFNEDKKLAVVFNGEIYNFRSLRAQLQDHGHVFKTRSDTEVLLHGFEEWRTDLVSRLRGMFAFAIWDDRTKELFLARDRIGIKPLYYYWDDRNFLFASEIKAILQDPAVERKIDPCALDDYLTYLYVPGPKTIFAGIRKLQPGHTCTASRDGIKIQKYWDLRFDSTAGVGEAECAEGLLETLRESVSSHLISDVPLGAFLSGGIDSSAVVGLMAGVMDQPVNTASIGFMEAAFNELPFAQEVARKFNTHAYERVVEAKTAQILDRLVWHFDEPFADSSMIPTYYVSQIAREHVTVCLSGDGGDENFAGYRRYRFDVLENRIRARVPGSIRRPVFGTLARVYPKADWLPQMFRAKTLLTNLSNTPEQAYFNTMSWFNADMKRLLYNQHLRNELNGYESFSVMKEHFARTEGWDPLARIQYVDIKTYLVDDILTKVDRTSMAHALEVRVPLLDHHVMEFAAGIPSRYKLAGGEGKYIFKQALKELIPGSILNRPKMGFSIPLAQWLRTELRPVFENHIFSQNAFVNNWFEPGPIQRWWHQHQRGTRDYSYHLWALLVLECWGKRFMAK
jgi:asparagine synthase (glutamine-hydrolysing)